MQPDSFHTLLWKLNNLVDDEGFVVDYSHISGCYYAVPKEERHLALAASESKRVQQEVDKKLEELNATLPEDSDMEFTYSYARNAYFLRKACEWFPYEPEREPREFFVEGI